MWRSSGILIGLAGLLAAGFAMAYSPVALPGGLLLDGLPFTCLLYTSDAADDSVLV